jgi:hypothetical protein
MNEKNITLSELIKLANNDVSIRADTSLKFLMRVADGEIPLGKPSLSSGGLESFLFKYIDIGDKYILKDVNIIGFRRFLVDQSNYRRVFNPSLKFRYFSVINGVGMRRYW